MLDDHNVTCLLMPLPSTFRTSVASFPGPIASTSPVYLPDSQTLSSDQVLVLSHRPAPGRPRCYSNVRELPIAKHKIDCSTRALILLSEVTACAITIPGQAVGFVWRITVVFDC
jgi:hypothetical protein